MSYMKLLNEAYIEDVTSNRDGESLYIEGIFLGANKKNRNGRTYSREIIAREVEEFQKVINANEALGELEHPDYAKINPKEAAIKIVSLKMDGDFAYGKAKVLEYMPSGKMLAGLLGDVRMGVSSRGVGDVNESGEVEDNYQLITIDAVLGPSCPDAYVNAVTESYEWILNESTGLYIEKRINTNPVNTEEIVELAKREFDDKVKHSNSNREEIFEAFRDYLKTISSL